MYFISYLVTFCLAPAHWLFFMLVWAYFTKKAQTRKRLLRLSVCIFFLFSNEFLYNTACKAWQTPPVILSAASKFEAGILLGGMMANGKDGQAYFTASSDRFIQIVELYHSRVIKKIVVSGGISPFKNGRPEGKSLYDELVESGVKADDIIVEAASVNTFENAAFSKKLLDSMQLKPPYVLVTSATHMPRSLLVFKKLGINVIPFPSDFKSTLKATELKDIVYPNIEVLNNWRYLIKELVGTLGYKITGKA